MFHVRLIHTDGGVFEVYHFIELVNMKKREKQIRGGVIFKIKSTNSNLYITMATWLYLYNS